MVNFKAKKFDDYFIKRVSFILITKNRAKFLDRALRQYRKLIKRQDELIIVDGASRDQTRDVISRHQDLVATFISEPDESATHAFNKGILLARGKYIKNLSDDDEIYPGAMEQAIGVMEKHPEVDLLVCGGTKENEGRRGVVYLPKGVNYGKSCEDVFLYGSCGVGFVIRRGSIAILGLCPDYASSDAAMALQFIKNGGIVRFCRINLYNHPIYSHSMIKMKSREVREEGYRMVKDYCSWSFYLRYRLEVLSDQHIVDLEKFYEKQPVLKTVLKPARFVYARLINLTSLSKPMNSLAREKDFNWDGGFS